MKPAFYRRRAVIGGIAFAILSIVVAKAVDVPLVTGKDISPPASAVVQNVGSLPMSMIMTPDRKFAISSDMGFRQSLWSIDAATGKGVSHLDFQGGTNGLYYGMAITRADGGGSTLYAAQGGNSSVAVVSVSAAGELAITGSIALPKGDFPAGLAIDRRGYLYVAINEYSTKTDDDSRVLTSPGAVAILDTRSGKEVSRYKFGDAFTNFPLAVAVLDDGSKAFVSSQRDGVVYVLDTKDAAVPKKISVVETGSHPVALLLNRGQNRLYVANAHSDTVSVVDTGSNKVVEATSKLARCLAKFFLHPFNRERFEVDKSDVSPISQGIAKAGQNLKVR